MVYVYEVRETWKVRELENGQGQVYITKTLGREKFWNCYKNQKMLSFASELVEYSEKFLTRD